MRMTEKKVYIVEGKFERRYEEMDYFPTLKDAKKALRRYMNEFPTVAKRIRYGVTGF